MTDVYEGSLIRLFRRLEELLRQMGQAAKVMGNDDLEKRFEETLSKIRRDIVVSCSLIEICFLGTGVTSMRLILTRVSLT